MADVMTISLRNDLSELGRVAQLVEAFGMQRQLPTKLVFDCNLALDEVLTNVISYGFDDGQAHEIVVRIEGLPEAIRFEVVDDGVAFNPLEVKEPDLEAPVESRPIGGLGVYMVRKLMSELAYRREGDKNVLVMTRRIDAQV